MLRALRLFLTPRAACTPPPPLPVAAAVSALNAFSAASGALMLWSAICVCCAEIVPADHMALLWWFVSPLVAVCAAAATHMARTAFGEWWSVVGWSRQQCGMHCPPLMRVIATPHRHAPPLQARLRRARETSTLRCCGWAARRR